MMKKTDTNKGQRLSSPTTPSNRLSHGLSSRAIAEARGQLAKELTDALIGDCPKTYPLLDAASSLAGAILHLAAIRRAKKALLTTGDVALHKTEHRQSDMVSRPAASEAQIREGKSEEIPHGMTDEFVASIVQGVLRDPDNVRMFARLYEYERKAISRRNRLLIQLDYLVLEARRRETAVQSSD
jgi:hypothetical protein